MKSNKIYFGHPINTYHTVLESKLIKIIHKEFPNIEIENPADEFHQENCEKYKKERGSGMIYFYEEILPKMSAGIFLPFRDGKLGAGVYSEAKFLYNNKTPVYEISFKGKIGQINLDSSRALSIDKTRKRILVNF